MTGVFEELESLLFDWEDGSLDQEGVERVREILRNDPKARSHFASMQIISAAMQLDSDVGFHQSSGESLPHQTVDHLAKDIRKVAEKKPKRQLFSTGFWLAGALSLVICLMAGWLIYSQFTSDPIKPDAIAIKERISDRKEATSSGIALVTRLVDINWDDDQKPLEVGDALTAGRLAIKSGFAQIEFFCGATVILEGPAELDLQSATLARVRSGRLRAQVPPAARGFSLEVDDMKVVDLGTEFALSVSDQTATIQVFDGEVELHQPSEDMRRLIAGEAVVRTKTGYEKSRVTPEDFVDIAGLESRAQGQRSARYDRWKAWSNKLRSDPRLITYYAFEQKDGWQRRLPCDIEPINTELDGAIVGARQVIGRWESKGALEFKQPADRVRVQIPGEYSSLTFACWVKIDSLDRWFNSLFLTDNYNLGEPHWQILDTGQIYFSVRPTEHGQKGPHDHKVLSPPFWKPSMSGKWLHLATTYDVEAKQITHYLNGNVLHTDSIPESKLVKTTRIGMATIGNWSVPTKPEAPFAIRNLNGSLDEFALFSAALNEDEIKEMYENGKP